MASSIPPSIHASHYVSPDALEEMEALASFLPEVIHKHSSYSLQGRVSPDEDWLSGSVPSNGLNEKPLNYTQATALQSVRKEAEDEETRAAASVPISRLRRPVQRQQPHSDSSLALVDRPPLVDAPAKAEAPTFTQRIYEVVHSFYTFIQSKVISIWNYIFNSAAK